MEAKWERALRVEGPLVSTPFLVLSGLAAVALYLAVWREFTGLGYVTGLNDGYSWGLFKNFNVTTLTALGSAGYAVGILTWLLNRRRYHVIIRTSVLISIISYFTGMLALGVDVGRPWNMIWMINPATWNKYSVLLEVAVCMTAYLLLGLQTENLPAFVERFMDGPYPDYVKRLAQTTLRIVKRVYPFAIAAAFVLPSMHQSSLGSLMMLAGPRVHPLWQTPMLPLLYLVMAYMLGFAAVIGILMVSCLIWRRPLDMVVLSRLGHVTSYVAFVWLALRIGDIAGRGEMGRALHFDFYSMWFLLEILLVMIPAYVLQKREWREDPMLLYMSLVIMTVGGLIYRYTPTTVAFLPGDRYHYFPSFVELLMSGGFVALGMILFLYTVKRYNILPVPLDYYKKAVARLEAEANNTTKQEGVPA